MSESSESTRFIWVLLAWLLGALPVGIVWLAAVGLGIVRDAPMLPVCLVSAMALILPAVGLSGALDDRRLGFAAGSFFWGIITLSSIPLFFPGERALALENGWAWVRGEEVSEADAWIHRLDRVLSGAEPEESEVDLVVSSPADTGESWLAQSQEGLPEVPATAELRADEVVLPYRPDDSSLVIPVELEGPDGAVIESYMTYDTGATLTTLNRDTLHRLGIGIPPQSPVIELRTASGVRTARLVVVDRVWLGGFEVEGVTVSVCEECASDNSVGLLGLNATGRFRVVVDQHLDALVLRSRTDTVDHLTDVEPWVRITGQLRRRPNGEMIVDLELENRSRRDIEQAVVRVRCERNWYVEMNAVPAGGTSSRRAELEGIADCESYELRLESARW